MIDKLLEFALWLSLKVSDFKATMAGGRPPKSWFTKLLFYHTTTVQRHPVVLLANYVATNLHRIGNLRYKP